MPPVMNRAPMTTRPMMNRPQAPMNRAQAPMVRPPPIMGGAAPSPVMGLGQAMGGAGGTMQQQGIAALLAAAAAKNPQSQMTGIGAGMQQLQPVRQDLSSMFTPEQLQKLRQVTGVPVQQAQQVPMGMPFQAGATFDPSLSYNPMQTATPLDALRPYNGATQAPKTEQDWIQHSATALYAPGTDMEKVKADFLAPQSVQDARMSQIAQQAPQLGGALSGVMGLGQAMGGGMPAYNPMLLEPGVLRPQPGNQGYSGPQQAPQGQMGMLANLNQMFNSMGGQQPAQQGGTPLQNNSSPLQQSAQPGMGLGQAMGGVMNPGLM